MPFAPRKYLASLKPPSRKWLLAGVVFAVTATPSFALFGVGDIVFDPTSYASLVSQLTTLETQYNMLKNNLTHFSLKQTWQTTLNQMKQANVVNRYGETNGMSTALNSNSVAASTTAWNSSTVALSPDAAAMVSTQPVGNSTQLSQLAMIEASDSASPDCLNAIGAYRAARATSLAAQQNLQAIQTDNTDATNTEVQQLNLINAGQAQATNEAQAQGVIQACMATQMTVENMQQRNAAAEDLNTWGFVQTQHTTNPTNNVSTTDTWTNYVP